MKIKIEVHGHQTFHEHEGEPLAWLNTTETYTTGGGSGEQLVYATVPCVVLRTATGIEVVSLKTQYTWARIVEVRP